MSQRTFLASLAVFSLLFSAGPAFGIGEQYGRITGIVYNQDGAVLAGVSLVLKSPALIGGPRRLSSAPDGAFVFNNLPSGSYELTAEQPGLKTITKTGLIIS